MTKSERETLQIIHRYLEDGYGYLSDGRVMSGIERTEKALTALIALIYSDDGPEINNRNAYLKWVSPDQSK